MKLKKNDQVQIVTGKDRGKTGKIEKVFADKDMVLIPGLNQYKKHRKSQGEGRPGEILTQSRPYLASKVALVCPKCKLPTRVGYKIENNNKLRICRKCDAVIN